MKLEKREVITLGVGALIVVLSVAYGFVKKAGSSASAAEGTVHGEIEKIERFKRVKTSVENLTRELGVTLTDAVYAEQEKAIVDDIGNRAKARNLQYTSLKPAQTSKSAASPSKPLQFRVELSGRFEDFVAMMQDMETSPIPYVIKDVHIDSQSRAAQRSQAELQGLDPEDDPGPPPPGNGRIKATLKLQSYLFPDAKSLK